jgi:predicted thioesterase
LFHGHSDVGLLAHLDLRSRNAKEELFMLTGLIKQTRFLANENSTTILTGVGVVGVVATAYLSGRATVKAIELMQTEFPDTELSLRQKVRLHWRTYTPTVVSAGTTIVCILMVNRIASKKIAALVVSAGVSERALKEYKERVVEKFGETKARDVQDDVAKKRIENNPVKEVIITGNGDVLCYDMYSGRYFESSHDKLRRAENEMNTHLHMYSYASLSEFYDEIGLPETSHSPLVGWNLNNPCHLTITTTMSSDNRPCLAFDFMNPPVYDYNKFCGSM